MRRERLENLIMKGKMEGPRGRGRPLVDSSSEPRERNSDGDILERKKALTLDNQIILLRTVDKHRRST